MQKTNQVLEESRLAMSNVNPKKRKLPESLEELKQGDYVQSPFYQHSNMPRSNVPLNQPRIISETEVNGIMVRKVMTTDLLQLVRSKSDLYNVFAIEGRLSIYT